MADSSPCGCGRSSRFKPGVSRVAKRKAEITPTAKPAIDEGASSGRWPSFTVPQLNTAFPLAASHPSSTQAAPQKLTKPLQTGPGSRQGPRSPLGGGENIRLPISVLLPRESLEPLVQPRQIVRNIGIEHLIV